MEFAKVHSLGNDFLVVRREAFADENLAGLAVKILDRHTGPGADGLLIIDVKEPAEARVGFRIFNADGSEAEISGNGLRCAAAYLHDRKVLGAPSIVFETSAGERTCELLERRGHVFEFRTDMGTPRFSSAEIPFDDGAPHDRIIDHPLVIQGRTYLITLVNMGNPHCCLFLDHFPPSEILFYQVGTAIEQHPFFPMRTNIEAIRVLNRKEIEAAFWERGVGRTLSSGSGACAAAVASILKGLTDREVIVRTTLGRLTVFWEKDRVFQSGPAEMILVGEYLG
jgi:diaminopimelate epimerase